MAGKTLKLWKRAESRRAASCDATCRLDERTAVERSAAAIAVTRVR